MRSLECKDQSPGGPFLCSLVGLDDGILVSPLTFHTKFTDQRKASVGKCSSFALGTFSPLIFY